MASPARIEYLTEAQFDQWDRFVDASDQGSIYSQAFFLRALCEAAGTHFKILTIWKGTELLGGIGLHFVPSSYGARVHPRGLLYYNGVVLRNFATKHPASATYRQIEIVQQILKELDDKKYGSLEMTNRPTLTDLRAFIWDGWHLGVRYTYQAPLGDLDKLWDGAEQNVRRLIKRCEQTGMQFVANDDFETFYRLHRATCQRKGVSPYLPFEPFQRLYAALRARNCAQIFFACLPDGKPVAAQIVLFSAHPVTHTWAAGSDAQYLESGASAFLRWQVFEVLHQRGFQANDLTDAMNPSVAKFKSQFGGTLVPCFMVAKINSPALRLRTRLAEMSARLVRVATAKFKPRDAGGSD